MTRASRPLHRAAQLVWLGGALLMSLWGPPALPALAHSELARSEPTANSVLPDSPPAVELWFTEAPEPRFSEVALYTTARVRIQTPSLQVAPEDRSALVVKLDPLPAGTYTVAWKVLSAVDGHTTAGAFAFAVGIGQTVTGPLSGVVSELGQTSQATPPDVVVRWLTYLGSSALLGALVFPVLVLSPAMGAVSRQLPGARLREGARDRKSTRLNSSH